MKEKLVSILMLALILTSTLSMAFIIRPSLAENGFPNENFMEKNRETGLPNLTNKPDQASILNNDWRNIFERRPSAEQGENLESPSQTSRLSEDKWNFSDTSEWSNFTYIDGNKTRLIVGVNGKNPASLLELEKIAAEHQAKFINTVSIGGEVRAVVVELLLVSVTAFVEETRAVELASYIEPNMKVQALFVPNDPYWSMQWGPQKIEADWAWNTTVGDPSVLVAVVDTGIDYTHPDLAANYAPLGYDWVNIDADPLDDFGHGTHCAGIIAAVLNNDIGIAGLAQVRIMAEKVLDYAGYGYWDWVANGIINATDSGADIISMSLGGYGDSELMHDAVKYAYDAGVLVIASAGNDNTNIKSYPAGYDEVIAVAATDQYDNKAGFSNWGDWIELAAPGVGIYSTMPTYHVTLNDWGYAMNYDYLSGTSMACPHVSGVAALVWSRYPSKTRDWVRLWLRYTADDLGDPGFDVYYGYGRINARKTVEQTPPPHELIVSNWVTPPYVKPGSLETINATILNFGENETDVTVQLSANSTIADSVMIDSLAAGNSTSVSLSWNPAVEGLYNVTLYVVPVPGETSVENNVVWKYIYVGFPVKAVVLHSAGNIDGDIITNWQVLNSEWRLFGGTMVYIDYTTLNIADIAYEDIVATEADVLIISCAYDPYAGWQFTDSEIEAITQYVHEGHGLIATAGTLYYGVPNNNKLAPLFGMSEATMWTATGTDLLHLLNTTHPIFNNVPDPLVFPQVQTALPYDGRWDSNELVDGKYLALGHYQESAIVTYKGLVYISPWLEIIPPYYHHHLQLLYNAITWSRYQNPQHELVVSLEAPKYLESGESVLLNATVYNMGQNNETGVELRLLINGTIVKSAIIPELMTGDSHTTNYLWNPTARGLYNVTAYAPPVSGEEFTGNNVVTKVVYVLWYTRIYLPNQWTTGGVAMGWHADDNSWSYTLPFEFPFYGIYYNMIYVSSNGLITFTSGDSSLGNSIESLAGKLAIAVAWDDWVTYEPYDIYIWQPSSDQVIIRWEVRHYGSSIVANFEAILSTNGIIQFNYGYNDGPISATIGVSNGAGDMLAEDVTNLNYVNTIVFTPFRPEHELIVSLWAPSFVELDTSTLLNATVLNMGLSNETDIDLQLLVNNTIVDSVVVSELLTGESYTLSHMWTPALEGICNVTAYAPPVENETFIANNKATKFATVRYPLIRPIEGQYANYTIYYVDPSTGLETFGGLWNFTYLRYVSPYQINITTWMKDPSNNTQSGWMIVNIFTRVVERDSGVGWAGMWYPGLIETNVTIGSSINLLWGNATIVDNEVIYINGRPIDCWEIRLEDQGFVYAFWYDKASGLWIGMRSAGPYGVTYLILTTTNIPIGFMDEHDLAVTLDAPTKLSPGTSILLNATVYNTGLSNETNVTLQLAINGSIVASEVIPELASSDFHTLIYLWTPVEGTYNITAYAPPVSAEEFTANNVATKIVSVRPIKYVLFDQTHGTDSIYSYSTWVTSLTNRGYVVETHTIDPITPIVLEGYDVFVIPQAHSSYTADELAAIQNFVFNGGGLLVIGDDNPSIYTDLTSFAGISWTSGGTSGTTTDITPHPVTTGVTTVYLYAPMAIMYVTGVAQDLVRDPAHNIILAVSEQPSGKIIGFADEDSLWNYAIGQADNLLLANNMIDWLAIPIQYEHDLAVSLDAPKLLEPGSSVLLNASVRNRGLNNETGVELQLLINGAIADSVVISELLTGESHMLSHLWTPTIEGIYNITAYAPAMPGENFTANNVKSVITHVQVLPDILIVNEDDGSAKIRGTSLPEFESALATASYDYMVWNESSMGNPPLEFLAYFKVVIWTCGDYWSWAVDPTDAVTLESYLAQGGNLILEGEDIGYNHNADSFMVNVAHAILQVDKTGAPGLTVTDPTHPVTFGLPASFTWLTNPPYDDGVSPTNGGAEVIQYTGTNWTAVTVFKGAIKGAVVYYAFPLYCLEQSYGERLAISSIDWLLGVQYEHDIAVSVSAPSYMEPNETFMLTAIVGNIGLSNETDVDLQLLINGAIVASSTISNLPVGSSYTLSHLWVPMAEGIYNVTAYAPPLTNETRTANNIASAYVSVIAIHGTSLRVTPRQSIVPVDRNFTISINVVNVTNLVGYQFYMYYDTRILDGLEIEVPPNHFLTPTDPSNIYWAALKIEDNYNTTHGRIIVCALLLPPEAPKNGSGVLVNIIFKARAIGDSTLHLTETVLADPIGEEIPHVTLDGSVEVILQAPADVAIVSVTPSSTVVYERRMVNITVVARNEGNTTETFNVTAYYDSSIIGTQLVVDLPPSENITLTFNWNTSGLTPCHSYTISAYAWPVPGEIDNGDNLLSDGTVKIAMLGDVNADGTINILDLVKAAMAFGAVPSSTLWDPQADIYLDDRINIFDLVMIALRFGQHY